MCVIPWRTGGGGATGAAAQEDSAGKEPATAAGDGAGPSRESLLEPGCAEDAAMHLLLVFGGMDTQGEIYRDCIVTRIA